MTHLRYFVPLATRIRLIDPIVRHVFVYDGSNTKYNGMRDRSNLTRYCEIIRELGFVTSIERRDYHDQVGTCDVLFTVESSTARLQHERHVSISHGLDFITHSVNLHDVDAYVCSEFIVGHPSLASMKKIVAPAPPSLLDIDGLMSWASRRYVIDERRLATVFYPDHGHIALADNVIEHLAHLNFNVYVKQRRKWQAVHARHGTHVYDASWSPAEAIALPLVSDIVVGFGSTAYLDLVQAGVRYVDCHVYGEHDVDMTSAPTFRTVRPAFDVLAASIDELLNCDDIKHGLRCAQDEIDAFAMGLIR